MLREQHTESIPPANLLCTNKLFICHPDQERWRNIKFFKKFTKKVIFRESTRGKNREKRTVYGPLIFILSFSLFSSLGPILCGFGL
jgi:hypothetical protein